MGGVSSTITPIRSEVLGLNPATAGIACCAVSALGYSAANICLRRLADLKCDPAWAIFNKELVTVVILGAVLVYQACRGIPTLPKGRPLVFLILVGLATELGGNVLMQWAFGVAGLAVMIPALSAFVLTSSAVFAWLLLGERVTFRTVVAIGFLLASLGLLGVGAVRAGDGGPVGGWIPIAMSIGVACLAGIIYAMLSITIRHCVTGTTRLTAVAVLITGMGVLTLGPLSVHRLGMQQILATPPEHFMWMIAAGVFNMIAFMALIQGLQLATVVYVNMLNATQVALAAVAGIAIFHEAANGWLVLGIALTIVGILSIGQPVDHQAVDQHI